MDTSNVITTEYKNKHVSHFLYYQPKRLSICDRICGCFIIHRIFKRNKIEPEYEFTDTV